MDFRQVSDRVENQIVSTLGLDRAYEVCRLC